MSADEHSGLEELVDDVAEELEEIEQRSPLARTLITVAVTVLVVAVIVGALLVISLLMRGTETASSSVDATEVPQVAIRAGDADVRVVEGERDSIDIEAEVTSGLLPTEYELRRRGPEIEVVSGCFALLNPGCGVQVEVRVPAGLPVEIVTDSGDVVAEGLGDRILTVVSGSGDVVAEDLTVDELSATTHSGAVTASFGAAPFAVKALTDSGDIDVSMPSDGQEYQVDVRSSGQVRQDLEPDEDASAFIRLLSDSGAVTLRR